MTPSPAGVGGARLLLDAGILYPIRICDFILTASTNGLLQRPIVSDTILKEAHRNVVADRPDLDVALIERRFANVRLATDGHEMRIPKRFIDDAIINAKDRHVIAAAHFHQVDVVVSNDRGLRCEVGAWAKQSERNLVALSADALVQRMIGHDRAAVDGPKTVAAGITGLPTCLVWKWAPIGNGSAGPDVLRQCSNDADGDGFDDAIDIPNNGIDENCDGSDLVVGQGKVQVTLIWDNDNDMDLHVLEPNGTRIWYASRGPTATGGRLDRDDNVFVCGRDIEPGGVENTYWPTGTTPQAGTYTVEVREYARCQNPANWVAEVRIQGALVKRITGSGAGAFTFSVNLGP